MNMTREEREFLTVLMNNKKVLDNLINGIVSKKQVKDLQMKESISLIGITWSKFAEDNEGNAYMLADENIASMKFGDSNDWRKSQIRKKLNEELYQKIVAELGANALVTILTDLFSHDGLCDYRKCNDNISLLTYDLYRNNRENIKNIDEYFWTCTPNSTLSGSGASYVQYVDSDGVVDYSRCGRDGGVRPFFILKSSIFVPCGKL